MLIAPSEMELITMLFTVGGVRVRGVCGVSLHGGVPGWLVGIAAPTVPFPQSLSKKTECPADPMTQQNR